MAALAPKAAGHVTAVEVEVEAARDRARIDLESTVVRAPVGGAVGNRQVRVGRLVAPGTALLDIAPLDAVRDVIGPMPGKDALLKPRQPTATLNLKQLAGPARRCESGASAPPSPVQPRNGQSPSRSGRKLAEANLHFRIIAPLNRLERLDRGRRAGGTAECVLGLSHPSES
ncbi:HlyD family efflux transporter periplasmic adaptor subunit [Azospirillum agricola]|uniref:HlyD family efflux transporter periplasmic adaptor subunit n=1 Tax=Azospirillum agricola TaxID=1720247 RepID=UPI000A0EF48B|nr:HlyD family efflux transporter periplasmic adaptor subunit [Azospirillum agricola]SMH38446.1 HlyD family secretion protein [Azospirillum lipoferum]